MQAIIVVMVKIHKPIIVVRIILIPKVSWFAYHILIEWTKNQWLIEKQCNKSHCHNNN